MKRSLDNEGFIHNGRIVYALQYRLDDRSTVICWLDWVARLISPFQPEEQGKLMVTVKSGDWITNGIDRRQVVSLEVYRSLPLNVS